MKQIIFAAFLLLACGGFVLTLKKIFICFSLTKPAPLRHYSKRFLRMLWVAFAQSKIFRWPWTGLAHALVFWGFLAILFGSVEMVIDGLTGKDRSLSGLGLFYALTTGAGDVFALIVLAAIIFFLARRIFFRIGRFHGPEMKRTSHLDALLALSLIALLMLSLLGMNTFYVLLNNENRLGIYPVGAIFADQFGSFGVHTDAFLYELSWWAHILLIMVFANLLPYSKHFHVFTSIPNVFVGRLEPLGKLDTPAQITREVRLMLDPTAQAPAETSSPERFGVKDVNDTSWVVYLSSLACTECGRCTAVCPANLTGKKLSPRKIFMDYRARMKQKGSRLQKDPNDPGDTTSLLRNYISEEELWACTACNACAQECPVDIHHPSLIIDMRRYLAMEEGAVPSGLKALFANVENNGAPWQFSPQDRLKWADGLTFTKNGSAKSVSLPLARDKFAKGEKPEYLFWVGCAGAFDDRAKKVSRAFTKILAYCDVNFAVLGDEESCTGDAVRRAGNEMLYQMQALKNIELLRHYEIKNILTTCPHCFNSFANEYSDLGGHYQVFHHSQFLKTLIQEGKLQLKNNKFKDRVITYHDPCYLGRANGEYESSRQVITSLGAGLKELRRNRSFALCCGAGGAQMFKEAEKGTKEVFMERMEDVLHSRASIVASACPFCMTMLTDGIKYCHREDEIQNFDIAELVAAALDL